MWSYSTRVTGTNERTLFIALLEELLEATAEPETWFLSFFVGGGLYDTSTKKNNEVSLAKEKIWNFSQPSSISGRHEATDGHKCLQKTVTESGVSAFQGLRTLRRKHASQRHHDESRPGGSSYLRWLERFMWVVAMAAFSIYIGSVGERRLSQTYLDWKFARAVEPINSSVSDHLTRGGMNLSFYRAHSPPREGETASEASGGGRFRTL